MEVARLQQGARQVHTPNNPDSSLHHLLASTALCSPALQFQTITFRTAGLTQQRSRTCTDAVCSVQQRLPSHQHTTCLFVCLLFYVIATSKGHIRMRTHGNFIVLSHWETSPCPILVMLNTWLGSDNYQILSHWFHMTRICTREVTDVLLIWPSCLYAGSTHSLPSACHIEREIQQNCLQQGMLAVELKEECGFQASQGFPSERFFFCRSCRSPPSCSFMACALPH